LRGNEVGTWAYSTIIVRMPEIARRVIIENDLSPAARAGIMQLIADIPAGPIRPLQDESAPDWPQWAAAIARYTGRDWLSIAWFFAETYFYRRIIEAVDYFQSELDPFRYQKEQGLATGRETLRAVLPGMTGRRNHGDDDGDDWVERISALLAVSLWGNQADLSLWPAGAEGQSSGREDEPTDANLLVDDRPAVANLLRRVQTAPVRIDIILDNAGYELVTDLVLIDALLAAPQVTVRAQAKIHPTFVSDATTGDVEATIQALAGDTEPQVAALGARLKAARESGRLQISSHPFWTSPRPGWALPADLRADLAGAQLVITKGDANYRRLLGDRHWSATAPFPAILAYFPAPLLALRTVKAQLIAGLLPGQAEATRRRDPDWMANGRWGMIQYSLPKKESLNDHQHS
jgi:uncharacterized protein with ATP-grasp and redox domains